MAFSTAFASLSSCLWASVAHKMALMSLLQFVWVLCFALSVLAASSVVTLLWAANNSVSRDSWTEIQKKR